MGGVGVGIPGLASFKEQWGGGLIEDADRFDGMAMFVVGRWFR